MTGKSTAAKEVMIVAGRCLGATVRELSEITGLNSSNVSRRYDAAITRRRPQADLYDPIDQIIEAYKQIEDSNIAITQA